MEYYDILYPNIPYKTCHINLNFISYLKHIFFNFLIHVSRLTSYDKFYSIIP